MAEARVEMARGADQMRAGAADMRREAERLQDRGYRERIIAENRARGQTTTHEQLLDVARRLPAQAADLERNAAAMEAQARERS